MRLTSEERDLIRDAKWRIEAGQLCPPKDHCPDCNAQRLLFKLVKELKIKVR